jgi:(p)ppGpp synthase/HD superfamily hydrolase
MNSETPAYSLLIEKAARMAITAHWDQKRKDDEFPYIIHPFMVATILLRYDFSDAIVAAALTHDVVEDTTISLEDVRTVLGNEVADIVAGVTEDKALPFEDRKKSYIEVLRRGSEASKAVALADKIHNMNNLLASYAVQGEDLWKKFTKGKDSMIQFHRTMLAAFQETWDHPMVNEYAALVKQLES